MVATCTLTGLVSWFTCAQANAPVGELFTIIVFAGTYLTLSRYPISEALPPSAFLASMVALGLLGVGAINASFAIGAVVVMGLAVAMLYMRNDTG